MPPKGKSSKKVTKQSTPESTWLSKFCRSNDIPEDVMDVLAQNQILSKSFLAAITEQDLADMGFVVGHKILLRRVISCLRQEGEDPQEVKAAVKESNLLPGLNLEEELSKLEMEFSSPIPTQDSQTANAAITSSATPPAATTSSATPDGNTTPEGKPLLPSDYIYGPDGKQLKPLQLSYSQFMLANVKILESLLTKNPREAAEYLTYLKFLAIKGTRFQTKAFVNKGSCKNPIAMSWLREIFWLSVQHNFHIHSRHLPGIKNVHADRLSRLIQSPHLSNVFFSRP